MKNRKILKSSLFVRDLLTIFSIEYIIIINTSSIVFLRIASSKKAETIFQIKNLSYNNESFKDFCKKLFESGYYYGQPIIILINTNLTYTYIKRLDNISPIQVLDKITTIKNEDVDYLYEVKRIKHKKVFVSQAIDKNLLSKIKSICSDFNLNVTRIISLPILLLQSILPQLEKKSRIHLFQIPTSDFCYLIGDSENSIVFNNFQSNPKFKDIKQITQKLKETYFEPNEVIPTTIYSDKPFQEKDSSHKLFGKTIKKGLKQKYKLKSLSYFTNLSKLATSIKVAFNSTKLLVSICLFCLVILSLSAVVTGNIASNNDELITAYQKKYIVKLNLEHKLDSLQKIEGMLINSQQSKKNASAIVSALCQKSYKNIFLNRIYIKQISPESTLVEISGVAKSENIIFKYHKETSKYVLPSYLSISSIKPEISNLRGKVDSILTFKFSMIVNEN